RVAFPIVLDVTGLCCDELKASLESAGQEGMTTYSDGGQIAYLFINKARHNDYHLKPRIYRETYECLLDRHLGSLDRVCIWNCIGFNILYKRQPKTKSPAMGYQHALNGVQLFNILMVHRGTGEAIPWMNGLLDLLSWSTIDLDDMLVL
nr:hypothetical protein [Tanacetum cinerariifolium]